MKNKKFESIMLIVYKNESGKFLADIEVNLDGQFPRFLFDTCAAKSQIKLDDITKKSNRLEIYNY